MSITQFNQFLYLFINIYLHYFVCMYGNFNVHNECVQSDSLLVLFLSIIVAKCLITILFNQQCFYNLYYS